MHIETERRTAKELGIPMPNPTIKPLWVAMGIREASGWTCEHLKVWRDELAADPAAVERTLAEGAGKAREIAGATLGRVKKAVGMGLQWFSANLAIVPYTCCSPTG